MAIISLVTASTLYGDNLSHYAIMMKEKDLKYVFLAFFTTSSNFLIGCAVLFQNMASNDIMNIFKNFAGLFIISTMDNMISEFLCLHVSEKYDADFLEVPFSEDVEDGASSVMKTQVYIYMFLNLWLFHKMQVLYTSKVHYEADWESFLTIWNVWKNYQCWGAFIPSI